MKTPEQEAVLRSIRKLVDFWRIEPEELIRGDEHLIVTVPVAEPVDMGPKYRHPVSGVTWDGQGGQPQWLKEALTKEGYTVEELKCPEHANAHGQTDQAPQK